MDFTLTEEQKLLQKEARQFLSREWPSAAMRQMLDDGPAAAREIWQKIARLGWPGLSVPEKFGGLGSDAFDLALLMEEMGRRLAPGTFFSTAVLAASALECLGAEEAKQEYLPAIAEGRLTVTLAVYEVRSGWDLSSLQEVNESGERIVKRFVPDAAGADTIFCVVRDADQVRLVVPANPEIRCLKSIDPIRTLAEVLSIPPRPER